MNGSCGKGKGRVWWESQEEGETARITLTGILLFGSYHVHFDEGEVLYKRIRPRDRSWLNVAWLKLRGWLRKNSGH